MKNLILLLALLAFVGCDENTPTKNEVKENLDKEYTLEELESDPNWVEITDIDTIMGTCIHPSLYYEGIIIRNEFELDSFISESIIKFGSLDFEDCNDDLEDLDIDTNTSNLILFSAGVNSGARIKRKIFRHIEQDYTVYYNELEKVTGYADWRLYLD
jgi:hypothetical protein